jgi:hypothetical protein
VVHVSGARGMTEDLLASGLYWTELRIILQVARSRSFNKAADELSASVTRRSPARCAVSKPRPAPRCRRRLAAHPLIDLPR